MNKLYPLNLNDMKVRIKKLQENAVMPRKAHDDDAGFDLVATSREFGDNGCVIYGTGLAFEIPQGYVGLVFPRSSIANRDIVLSNSVGVIDSGYRGEVMMKFKPPYLFDVSKFGLSSMRVYEIGERIGQIIIIPYPQVEFIVTESLSVTERGTGGYGSTGL